MATSDQFHSQVFDEFQPAKKVPDTLNVLTILTFVGSGVGILSSIWTYLTICQGIPKLVQTVNKVGEDSFWGRYLKDSIDVAYRHCDLKLPLLLVALICMVLCVIGALMMRKLSKKGYFIYLIGELTPPVVDTALAGGHINFMSFFSFLIPAVFLILYATQMKHMK